MSHTVKDGSEFELRERESGSRFHSLGAEAWKERDWLASWVQLDLIAGNDEGCTELILLVLMAFVAQTGQFQIYCKFNR